MSANGPEPVLSRDAALTVTQLTLRLKAQLEGAFPRVWVRGELSNFRPASSGHWYFILKDGESQIRVTMWRSSTGRLAFRPRDGMEVLLCGALNLYGPRGEYGLIADRMEELGQGKLRLEFEKLKARLAAEGLFSEQSKKPLPLLPGKIGLITSATGAALQDLLRVLRSRRKGLHILIYPVRVQGDGAGREIAEAVSWMDGRGGCDVLIVGRGGGSEEDLWAFNDESLARAIFACRTPVVSAVGHEVDFTIADFVADLRASTPSNAAEQVVRTDSEYRNLVAVRKQGLERAIQNRLREWRSLVNFSENSPVFIRVRSRIYDALRRVAEARSRMDSSLRKRLSVGEALLLRAHRRLRLDGLKLRLQQAGERRSALLGRLTRSLPARLEEHRAHLGLLAARLEDLSPLRVLARGYCVVYNRRNQVVRSRKQLRFGESIRVHVQDGAFHARVIETESATQPGLFE
jgi:exodeoxyribonuclease VII large subunit